MAEQAGSIGIPTTRGIGRSLGQYGSGLIAGLGFNLISNVVGSSLIGGAIAAALTGAVVKGNAGEIIAISVGFQAGQRGFGQFNNVLGGFGGLFGGGGGGGGGNGIETI